MYLPPATLIVPAVNHVTPRDYNNFHLKLTVDGVY